METGGLRVTPAVRSDGRAVLLNNVSEAAFMRQVITWARRGGYLVYHCHDSRNQEWGTDAGVPDLILAKAGEPLLIPELKAQRGRVTLPQTTWLQTLRLTTGVEAPIWRPGDGDAVRLLLCGK